MSSCACRSSSVSKQALLPKSLALGRVTRSCPCCGSFVTFLESLSSSSNSLMPALSRSLFLSPLTFKRHGGGEGGGVRRSNRTVGFCATRAIFRSSQPRFAMGALATDVRAPGLRVITFFYTRLVHALSPLVATCWALKARERGRMYVRDSDAQ